MHIFEIIEPTETNKQYKGEFDPSRIPNPGSHKEEPYNTGHYSKVRQNKKDPHTIIKRPHNTTLKSDDPFWEYIEMIKKYKLWENPHFPRFYNVTTIKDKSKKEMKKLEMEKLISGDELNDKQLNYLIDLYFNEEGKREIKEIIHPNYNEWISYNKWTAMVRMLSKALEWNKISTIENDLLLEAIKTLIKIRREINKDSHRNSQFDIVSSNIMVRMTSYGPQIVFTDPLSDV